MENQNSFSIKFEWCKSNSEPEIPDGEDPIIVEILPPFEESEEDIMNSIEDSVASYFDAVEVESFEALVLDVMDWSGYNYRIIERVKPLRTILV